MKLSKNKRLLLYKTIKKKLLEYSRIDIENGIMFYCLSNYGCCASAYYNKQSNDIAILLEKFNFPTEIEYIIEFFESLLEQNNINKNGIVFTPKYVAEYIIETALSSKPNISKSFKVIDPACGCGIFLVSAVETILNRTGNKIDAIIEENIYGIDILIENVRCCKLILKLLSAKHGGDFESINPNIVCCDSLKTDWSELFRVNSYDCIIGNPPYVNPHDLNVETVKYLKNNFCTTQDGIFNIFYAFIEKGIKELDSDGILSYIIPNNFLTIKSAQKLREYLQLGKYIKTIINFGDNMVFKPVRTYNCIIQLSKNNNVKFDYCVLPKVENIRKTILNLVFEHMEVNMLDKKGWNLVDKKTQSNLKKIENQSVPIKNFIRTGIATLRDAVYIVNKDDVGYYKFINSKKFYIESDLVKPLYKISDLKLADNIEKVKRYIIFPYINSETGYKLIKEDFLSTKYPKTYEYLKMYRHELDSRDKGRGTNYAWYAYGRTQGLNKYGEKLLFPTFANKPKFMLSENKEALFCNGYAIFENEKYDLEILSKILNSKLMEYYVSNTSYSIEGGYYCYQKKYIERFSLPRLTEKDLSFINKASKYTLDKYLWDLYGLE